MKILLTISILFLVLSCRAQEPDVECYSQEYIDSIIQFKDSQIQLLQDYLLSNELMIEADTHNIDLYDDNILINIDKQGHDIWVRIIDVDKRINTWYVDSKSEFRIGIDTVINQTWLPDERLIKY